MVDIPHPDEGPSAEDWFAMNYDEPMERLTDEIAKRPMSVGEKAIKAAERIADGAEQTRWDQFAHPGPTSHHPASRGRRDA